MIVEEQRALDKSDDEIARMFMQQAMSMTQQEEKPVTPTPPTQEPKE